MNTTTNLQFNTPGQAHTFNTLTFSEAWEYVFQRKISKDKLYSEVRAGRIPHTRIGTKILFRRDTLIEWFRQQELSSIR
jgi:excisionase family DNA binding protein